MTSTQTTFCEHQLAIVPTDEPPRIVVHQLTVKLEEVIAQRNALLAACERAASFIVGTHPVPERSQTLRQLRDAILGVER